MRHIEFYTQVVSSEDAALRYLREKGIICELTSIPSCPVQACGGKMHLVQRKTAKGTTAPYYRCNKKACRKSKTLRRDNTVKHKEN